MQSQRLQSNRCSTRDWSPDLPTVCSAFRAAASVVLGIAVMVTDAVGLGADSGELRYIEVQSTLGQMYDTAVAADDAETFGLSIPRGTALPRRLYPVRNLGVPMIQRLNQPEYKEVLLRHPQRNYTEYLDPNPEMNQVVNPSPSISFVTSASARTIILSWPTTAIDWTLESAASVNSDTAWTLVPPSLYQTNGNAVSYVVTVVTSGARFFRLHKP